MVPHAVDGIHHSKHLTETDVAHTIYSGTGEHVKIPFVYCVQRLSELLFRKKPNPTSFYGMAISFITMMMDEKEYDSLDNDAFEKTMNYYMYVILALCENRYSLSPHKLLEALYVINMLCRMDITVDIKSTHRFVQGLIKDKSFDNMNVLTEISQSIDAEVAIRNHIKQINKKK